jgi:hypothetical protein
MPKASAIQMPGARFTAGLPGQNIPPVEQIRYPLKKGHPWLKTI